MENFYTAAVVVIVIPYGLMFLGLVWNVIGPAMGKRRPREADRKTPAAPE